MNVYFIFLIFVLTIFAINQINIKIIGTQIARKTSLLKKNLLKFKGSTSVPNKPRM